MGYSDQLVEAATVDSWNSFHESDNSARIWLIRAADSLYFLATSPVEEPTARSLAMALARGMSVRIHAGTSIRIATWSGIGATSSWH